MIYLGFQKITDKECEKVLQEQKRKSKGVISWSEFLEIMVKIKGTLDHCIEADILDKKTNIDQVENFREFNQCYNIEERSTYSLLINEILTGDDDLTEKLPISPYDDDLFDKLDDGILLCKLLMKIDENIIDSRAINRMKNMNEYQINENFMMGLTAAKCLGIELSGINSEDFINKNHKNILEVIWKIICMWISKSINLINYP